MFNENHSIKQRILDYAHHHGRFDINRLVEEREIRVSTARQYLSALAKENKIKRIGNGEYVFTDKQVFKFIPASTLKKLYRELKAKLPYTDFCIYDGGIFMPFQHHVAVNHAVYVETNKVAVDVVFARLKDARKTVYKQPDAAFMYDYVNLQDSCIIVKPLVTESPISEIDGVVVPTLEKLLVDIQKDDDFDYMRGTEALYMYQTAFDQYVVNTRKLFRYAKRRGAYENIQSLVKQLQLI